MKKIIKSLTTTILLILLFVTTVFAQSSFNNVNQIDILLEKRAELISLEKWNEIESIDKQLESLGVEKLTSGEVEKYFSNLSDTTPYVVPPASNNVTWLSSRTDYTYGGITYEIQTLIAQPNQNDSNLKERGNKSISSSYKWNAGSMDALSVIASSTVGEIPGASLYLSVYDTVRSFISGISKTTEISDAEILYSYSHVSTISFKYVKIKGESDNRQVLTYISSKGTTAVGYQYPNFVYSGSSVKPNIIQGNRTINSIPSGYNSNLNAVKAYNTPYGKREFVKTVQITGLESKTVSKIYPICPESPFHIY